ncbi:MAG: pyridoxamine 5'-phosphate oxidase [Candidatus Margulisiibacteriota bacterium]
MILDSNPFNQFKIWYQEALTQTGLTYPNAMTVSTVDAAGRPNSRILLLKDMDESGFVFYTNAQSVKGHELDANPNVALLFFWESLKKQVRIRGRVEPVEGRAADDYFHSRPKESQLGAVASQQSRVLDSRQTLEQAVSELNQHFLNREIPRPDHWHGYRVVPVEFEFWIEGAFRLHDRFRYTLESGQWVSQRLYP